MERKYIFQSERLGFRNWSSSDIDLLEQINCDSAVMEFFPATISREDSIAFIERMQKQFMDKGFCYFAVDILTTKECIGFIGLSEQTYAAPFTPCIDIGWRIKKEEWNKGYATEGAKRCLEYAFHNLGIKQIVAVAPKVNLKSEAIMKKIGMQKSLEFEHPALSHTPALKLCLVYEIVNNKTASNY